MVTDLIVNERIPATGCSHDSLCRSVAQLKRRFHSSEKGEAHSLSYMFATSGASLVSSVVSRGVTQRD